MRDTTHIFKKILELAKKRGVIQVRDLRKKGIHPEYLRRLCDKGQLIKLAKGQYALPDTIIGEHHSLVVVAKAVPNAVICLVTALRFHDIGTQMPYKIWMAIERRAATPRMEKPEIRLFRFSGAAYSEGIQKHVIEGVEVKVYNPAKTVADCFKYRNKIGLDVAIEALRDGWRQRKISMDDLSKYSKICRVANIMKPYLETLT
ncbi:MAG: transcriptional regulator [Gammaproteobacteria bacterium]|nr:transcriptional regulator [Gammaproteobacteria bacterium]